MNSAALTELERLLPEKSKTDDKTREHHSVDQVGDDRYAERPEAVVFPETTEDVITLVRWANEHRIAVTARGAGSGLAGAAIPAAGGVVCSFARMNRIIEIDSKNMMVTLEPGVVTNALDTVLEEYGLFFAGYPMSEDICFLGGNVAENAGGGRALKYGVTSNYVLGLEVVTGRGEVLRLGGKHIKDVTGYNVLQLIVGSEGTLGLITRIVLRVIRRPRHRAVLLASFEAAADAAACVNALRGMSSISSIEFVDGPTAHATNQALAPSRRTSIDATSDAVLLVELDDSGDIDISSALSVVDGIVGEHLGSVTESAADAETIGPWQLRKQVPWWVKRVAGRFHSLEDVVIPPAALSELVRFVQDLRGRYAIPIAMFGHAGDGNFHVTPMKAPDMPEEEWDPLIRKLLEELYEFVLGLDGAISGEHGIGRKRVGSFVRLADPSLVELTRSLKAVFDPNSILNPGVIINQERTHYGVHNL